ncbi:hypothetical protein GWC95_05200 [Sediminibacterium roseum]|uniref:Uncharacterized protein n=1 Tax=Sediminibacterium roseum TaxID=1978412 RepID=A0ABW9ZWS0_9BACT|nr:hypothetical protein [Sediminibacterium roseum]NCI49311.1 hypothetical protein [Sediminibacterium roseum]
MNRYNPFSSASVLFPYRWFIVILLSLGAFMGYKDLTGGTFFQSSKQEQWTSNGPGGYHK